MLLDDGRIGLVDFGQVKRIKLAERLIVAKLCLVSCLAAAKVCACKPETGRASPGLAIRRFKNRRGGLFVPLLLTFTILDAMCLPLCVRISLCVFLYLTPTKLHSFRKRRE